MSWGSFLIGGLSFGIFSFILGVLIGTLCSSNKDVGDGFSKLVEAISKNLSANETVNVHLIVGKGNDNGDNFDYEPSFDPILGRDKWEPN